MQESNLTPSEELSDDGAKKSSRSYSDRTLKILWGRAAGRCAVADCRMEIYLDATELDPMVPIGEIAHIEAASDKGPRANPGLTKKERDEYENLIILCSNCHKRFDGQKKSTTVEMVLKIKSDHEAWVRSSLPERGRSTTGWVPLLIHGQQLIDSQVAITAISPDFAATNPFLLEADPQKETWSVIHEKFKASIDGLLAAHDPFEFRLALFALAPVSAGILAGYLLTSRPRLRLFQYHRDAQTWSWPAITPPSDSIKVKDVSMLGSASKDIAFKFELSAHVEDDIVVAACNPEKIVSIYVETPSTGWLQSASQLLELAKVARTEFERCVRENTKAQRWHFFYAGPAPGSVIVGQQVNPTMCPSVQLYEFRRAGTPAYQPSTVLE
jgi:hypothetical protein